MTISTNSITQIVIWFICIALFLCPSYGQKVMQSCFGRKYTHKNLPTSSLADDPVDQTNQLSCYVPLCNCWANDGGTAPWQVATGDRILKGLFRRCFGKDANEPEGDLVFADSSNAGEEAILASCKITGIESLSAVLTPYTYQADMEICTKINDASENCEDIGTSNGLLYSSPLIRNLNGTETVELLIKAKNFGAGKPGKRGGMAAFQKLSITGQTKEIDETPAPSTDFACDNKEDCSYMEIKGDWQYTSDQFGVFTNAVTPKGTSEGYRAVRVDPMKDEDYSKAPSIKVFNNGQPMKGDLKFAAYTSTNGVLVEICNDKQLTQCSKLIGSDNVTVLDYAWKDCVIPLQGLSEIYLACSNRYVNIGYCGLDKVQFDAGEPSENAICSAS